MQYLYVACMNGGFNPNFTCVLRVCFRPFSFSGMGMWRNPIRCKMEKPIWDGTKQGRVIESERYAWLDA